MRSVSDSPVVFVTASYPWGTLEDFFGPELAQLSVLMNLVVVPVWPRRPLPVGGGQSDRVPAIVTSPYGAEVLAGALLELLTNFRASIRAVAHSAVSDTLRGRLRGLATVPKGLWLGRRVRQMGAGHVHALWASAPATVALAAAETAGVPWSMTVHRGDIHDRAQLGVKLRRVAWIRGVSQFSLDQLRSICPADAVEQVVVHLGVDVPSTPRGRVPSRPGEPWRLLCPAQLIPLKRQVDVLQATRLLLERGHQVELDLAGEGPDSKVLRQTIEDLGLQGHARLLGQVPHDRLLARYAGGMVDAVVLASEIEGIPVSLMEAMAAGIAVVATGVGGVPELLDDVATTVPVGDVGALADAIERLLVEPGWLQAQVAAGRKRIEQQFDASSTARRMARLFADD